MTAVKLAIVGMGMIGKRHHQAMKTLKEAELIAIVDPAEQAKEIALNEGIRWFGSQHPGWRLSPDLPSSGLVDVNIIPAPDLEEVELQQLEFSIYPIQ